jgi:D-tyrosyl-tRNA(Tyr) deacylase
LRRSFREFISSFHEFQRVVSLVWSWKGLAVILVLQRVSRAQVRVEGNPVGSIGVGLLVLAAVERGDGEAQAAWCARKVGEVRIFPDGEGKMNASIRDVGGSVLAVSQFTLVGDLRKGTRPSFSDAAPPEEARALFDRFVALMRGSGLRVETGVFQAMMEVELVNDGPVTLVIRRPPGPSVSRGAAAPGRGD